MVTNEKPKSSSQQRPKPNANPNPKEEIINYMCKYIKQTQNQDNVQIREEVKEYNETVQNLRDFL